MKKIVDISTELLENDLQVNLKAIAIFRKVNAVYSVMKKFRHKKPKYISYKKNNTCWQVKRMKD